MFEEMEVGGKLLSKGLVGSMIPRRSLIANCSDPRNSDYLSSSRSLSCLAMIEPLGKEACKASEGKKSEESDLRIRKKSGSSTVTVQLLSTPLLLTAKLWPLAPLVTKQHAVVPQFQS